MCFAVNNLPCVVNESQVYQYIVHAWEYYSIYLTGTGN